MFQNHSLNANGKLLRRFYEPLVLLRVLDPTRGAHRPDLITDRGLDEKSKLWRNYVDQLSFVCDSDKGGDTVTAVAAQQFKFQRESSRSPNLDFCSSRASLYCEFNIHSTASG